MSPGRESERLGKELLPNGETIELFHARLHREGPERFAAYAKRRKAAMASGGTDGGRLLKKGAIRLICGEFPPLDGVAEKSPVVSEAKAQTAADAVGGKLGRPVKELAVGGTGDLRGIHRIPRNWGELPAEATFEADVRWVHANRLLVVRKAATGMASVELGKASSPAPSHGALGWLEFAVMNPTKFMSDLVPRVLKDDGEDADEEGVKRERKSIEELREVLAEFVEAEAADESAEAVS